MKRMIFALLLVISSSARAGVLESVAPYVGGEWRFDGAWKSGETLQARETYEWSVGKKFIVAKTFVMSPKGEYQRYETIFGEENGKLMAWSFVFDGHQDVSEFVIDGRKLTTIKPIPAADGDPASTLHQSIELTDPDKFRWQVSIQKNGKDDPIMDSTWVRSHEVTHPEIHFAQNPPSSDDKLMDAIAPLIGNWRIDAKWADGNELIATHSFNWGPGKKFIICKTALFKPDGVFDYDRYYTLFGVKGGKLTAFHFIFDGTTDFEPQTVDGKRISSVRTFQHPEGETKVNQFVELIDANTLHWKVWTDKDGIDKPMMDANWNRIEPK